MNENTKEIFDISMDSRHESNWIKYQRLLNSGWDFFMNLIIDLNIYVM